MYKNITRVCSIHVKNASYLGCIPSVPVWHSFCINKGMSIKRLVIIFVLIVPFYLSAGTEDTVYCFMGHGGRIGYDIAKLYESGYKYITGVGCELNARLGYIDASIMEKNVPGYPAQFWTYGTHFDKVGVGLNPYNNAGYDPVFSFTLKPHQFAQEEYASFLVDVEAKTPLLNNWGKYVIPYEMAESAVVGAQGKNVAVINAVGSMRALQQTWLASMSKAVDIVLSNNNISGVDLIFSYDMTETFFYEQLYKYASNTDYKSDKEILDYKVLVLKENIKDGDVVVISDKNITVPRGYIEDLKNNYPMNYEKNLKSDGSITFRPIVCYQDTNIKIESIPDILKIKSEKTYRITKDIARAIRNSKCAEFFRVEATLIP